MSEFRMPSLGADMEYGRIVEWLVKEGDPVKKGDIVAVVDTDKSTIEIEVFESGTVGSIVVPVGREVPVGAVLATIAAGEGAASGTPPAGPPMLPPPTTVPAVVVAAEAVTPSPVAPADAPQFDREVQPDLRPRVRASPLARHRAAASGVDIAAVTGTGPGGAVRVADIAAPGVVERARKPAVSAGSPDASGPRAPIAKLMARSKREIPHYYLATTIEMHAAMSALARWNETLPPSERLLPAALLLKATALVAREVPVLHGTWTDRFVPATEMRLGVAVARRGGGLVAPSIAGADEMPLVDLMAALRELVARVRSDRLRGSDVAEPTITVTNLGEGSIDEVFGVIYPPQVALVGFGGIVARPWVVDDHVEVRPVVRATVAADHRASDGHDGARFLAALDRRLQQPEAL